MATHHDTGNLLTDHVTVRREPQSCVRPDYRHLAVLEEHQGVTRVQQRPAFTTKIRKFDSKDHLPEEQRHRNVLERQIGSRWGNADVRNLEVEKLCLATQRLEAKMGSPRAREISRAVENTRAYRVSDERQGDGGVAAQ